MSVKQVIVIRKDLGMRRGKEIAQGAHAPQAGSGGCVYAFGERLIANAGIVLQLAQYFDVYGIK